MLFKGKATDALTQRPDCDICKSAIVPQTKPAAVDGATQMGPWGYMCIEHHKSIGRGLGEGAGQALFCNDEHDELIAEAYSLKPNTTKERIAVYRYKLGQEANA
jgi:hypothetical protein